ncbi:MAG: hypothetical protein M5R36_11990 [Deltaproteobacteria bacterium]|nr:hypothetical protein [Deltaproteobacteria bacterium]
MVLPEDLAHPVVVTADSTDSPHIFYSDDEKTYYAEKSGENWDIAEFGDASGFLTATIGSDDAVHVFGAAKDGNDVWYATDLSGTWVTRDVGDRCEGISSARATAEAVYVTCDGYKGEVNVIAIPFDQRAGN